MKLSRYFLLTVFAILFTACNQDKKADTPVESEANIERLKGLKSNENSGNIASQRSTALSILNHRLKNDPQSYAIIEADVWEYEFVFDGEMSKQGEYAGVWIDFKPDFTYEYGKNATVNGSGRYNYHFERGELLMIDNDPKVKPQEWTVKNAGDAMVLVGTQTYRDNSVQMKLIRQPDSFRQ
ncbi:MAG: hypothetical protein HKN09_04045 [Saprospiraceae bacterium]|nr:hypothetical protein [Saprospiraceae bacterium]